MSRNDITGDPIRTRVTTDAYRDGYERLYGGKRNDNTSTKNDNDNTNDKAKPSGAGNTD